jgi:hypothetical protein
MDRFLGIRGAGSAATSRGKAVEEGVNKIIELLSPDEYDMWSVTDPGYNKIFMAGVAECNKVWKEEISKVSEIPDADFMKFGTQAIADSINYLISLEPSEIIKQVEINTTLDGCEMPVRGYIDYVILTKDGGCVIIDKKTSGRTKTVLPQGYVIQGAIYHKAIQETGKHVDKVVFDFSFFSKKECKSSQIAMTQSDINYGISLATSAARAIEKVKNASEFLDEETFRAFLFPDIDSMFNQDEINAARKVFL